MNSPKDIDFADRVCLRFLQSAQNKDGGWGFHAGAESRVEPTSWALQALKDSKSSGQMRQSGFEFLRATQLADGSWPPSAGQQIGSWVTSLACWALLEDDESRSRVAAGLRWISDDVPRREPLIGRLIRKMKSSGQVKQDHSLQGWGWTPETASWVEPTAFALISLSQASSELRPVSADERIAMGKALLYDRMCPGGGWNCGNPMVYGVAGEPLVEPTVWALLALRDGPDDTRRTMSFEWLEKNVPKILGPGSLALAKICFDAYGRNWPVDAPCIADLYERNEFLDSVAAMAWACMGRPGCAIFSGKRAS